MLQPKQEYVRSIIHQLLTLTYWRTERRLPFWGIFKKDVAKFNEEPIELSFSLLGRSLQNDSMRNNLAHVRDKYRGIKSYIEFKAELQSEFLDKDTMKSVSGRFYIKDNNPKLAEVKAWLSHTLNRCRYNDYTIYADEKAYKSAQKAREFCSTPGAGYKWKRLYLRDTGRSMNMYRRSWRDCIESDWAVKALGPTWSAFTGEDAQQEEEDMDENEGEENQSDEEHVEREPAVVVRPMIEKVLVSAQSDDQPMAKRAKKVVAPRVPRSFENKTAQVDAQQKAVFDKLVADWRADNPGKTLTNKTWYAFDDLSKKQTSQSGGLGRRPTYGRSVGAYSERDNDLALTAAIEYLD